MDELQSGPPMVKSLMGRRHFSIELSLKYGYASMWNNELKISEFVIETLSCHF
jgi:hypothetical protein